MPPKKSKKAKGKAKGPAEKVYKLLTWEDMQNKELKYLNHIANLNKCLKYIEDSTTLQTEIEAQELLNKKWLEYLNCCPLPKPYIPPDIRLSVEKLKFFEKESIERTINWVLAVNERSILSQDIFAKNLTRKALKSTIKPDFGHDYNEKIEFCLNVLKRIEYFLLSEVEVNKCGLSVLQDIKKLRWNLQKEIQDFFNSFTYRILSSEKAYMNSVDAVTADYSFQGENFEIHIWCLKNVPIRFNQLEEPHIIAKLESVRICLQIPENRLEQNFTLRAIRFNFDHISEKAKSFLQEEVEVKENLNAGIEELPKCLINEWQMQLDIQKSLRSEMLAKRQEYEEKLRLFEEQQEKQKKKRPSVKDKKEASKAAKKKKITKPTKEPPQLAENMFPDVWEDFLQTEQKQYLDFINFVYNPKNMDLTPDEINLKKYFILGGIYQIYKIQKPIHFDFQSFDMTWHENGSNLIIDNQALIKPNAKLIRRSTFTPKRLTTRSLSIKVQDVKQLIESPWYVVYIDLPEYLCYWGEPIVCQYVTVTKIKEKDPPLHTEDNAVAKESSKNLLKFSITKIGDGAIADTSLSEPQKFGINSSMFNIQRPLEESFFRDSVSNILLAKSEELPVMPARDAQGVLNINDFPLTVKLNNPQIRDIQRHIIPRIISSFKFPKEILEDEILAESQRKIKSRGGVLLRKRADVRQDVEHAKGFYFGPKQSNPERVIALFSPVETVRLLQTDIEEDHDEPVSTEPKTFAQLLKIINAIKWNYKLRPRNILDLKPFKSKFPIVNKHIENRLRKLKAKESLSIMSGRTDSIRKSKTRHRSYSERSSQKRSIILKDDLRKTIGSYTEDTLQDVETIEEKESTEKEELKEEEPETFSYDCWTTKHIFSSNFEREKRTIIIQTDRLGYFGLAFKRYEHFPFKYWKLEPNPDNPENEVIFTLDTQYVRCVLNISENGIKGHVTEPSTKFVRNPKMYLILEKPISDYVEFKKIFKEKYLNIFADHDASYYIENGYFSEKHLSTELHTYNCMAINSTQIKFSFSQWNRLAKRRDIILKFLQYQDLEENTVEVRITPEEASFVDIIELCSDNVDVINLQYNLTWRNITSFSDLSYLINSMYIAANELKCKNAKLIYFIRNLLFEIRPLSFS